MSAPRDPGPDEGRGVAARLVYDPKVATVSEETFNELIAIMRDGPTGNPQGPGQLLPIPSTGCWRRCDRPPPSRGRAW